MFILRRSFVTEGWKRCLQTGKEFQFSSRAFSIHKTRKPSPGLKNGEGRCFSNQETMYAKQIQHQVHQKGTAGIEQDKFTIDEEVEEEDDLEDTSYYTVDEDETVKDFHDMFDFDYDDIMGDTNVEVERDEKGEKKAARAKAMIPQDKLLNELEKGKTRAKFSKDRKEVYNRTDSRNMIPLEKQQSNSNRDRLSYRQKRMAVSVQALVQEYLVEEGLSDLFGSGVEIIEVNVSPDLRRAIAIWNILLPDGTQAHNSSPDVQAALESLPRHESRIRVQMTRHLNFKYAPLFWFKYELDSTGKRKPKQKRNRSSQKKK